MDPFLPYHRKVRRTHLEMIWNGSPSQTNIWDTGTRMCNGIVYCDATVYSVMCGLNLSIFKLDMNKLTEINSFKLVYELHTPWSLTSIWVLFCPIGIIPINIPSARPGYVSWIVVWCTSTDSKSAAFCTMVRVLGVSVGGAGSNVAGWARLANGGLLLGKHGKPDSKTMETGQ